MAAAHVMRPTARVLCLLNALLLAHNADAIRRAGRRRTPAWMVFVVFMQLAVTLQTAASWYTGEAGGP